MTKPTIYTATEATHQLFLNLLRGERYILKSNLKVHYKLFNSGEYKYFVPQANLWISESDNPNNSNFYIHWNYYGESAVKALPQELQQLLDVTFDGAKPEDFVPLNYNTLCNLINNDL